MFRQVRPSDNTHYTEPRMFKEQVACTHIPSPFSEEKSESAYIFNNSVGATVTTYSPRWEEKAANNGASGCKPVTRPATRSSDWVTFIHCRWEQSHLGNWRTAFALLVFPLNEAYPPFPQGPPTLLQSSWITGCTSTLGSWCKHLAPGM